MGLVVSTVKNQRRKKYSGNRRSITFHYHLNIDGTKKNKYIKTFLNNIDIGERTVRNWVINSEQRMNKNSDASFNKFDDNSMINQGCLPWRTMFTTVTMRLDQEILKRREKPVNGSR